MKCKECKKPFTKTKSKVNALGFCKENCLLEFIKKDAIEEENEVLDIPWIIKDTNKNKFNPSGMIKK